jgi:Spy/CpxP family protein refolding chaperone
MRTVGKLVLAAAVTGGLLAIAPMANAAGNPGMEFNPMTPAHGVDNPGMAFNPYRDAHMMTDFDNSEANVVSGTLSDGLVNGG